MASGASLTPKQNISEAIIKTLIYADLFNQALTSSELRRYLLDLEVNETDLIEICNSNFEMQNDVWCLQGRAGLIDLKVQQQQIVDQKLRMARHWLWVFKALPWVKLVAVTGSVGGGSPKKDDDIDFLVITNKNRLWLSRFLITGFLSVLGKRRRPTDDPDRVDNKLCLNMWLSEERLASDHQDLYVANELAHMVPILNRSFMYERYIGANGWVKQILPNFFHSVQRPVSSVQDDPDMTLYPHLQFGVFTWVDAKLEQWQLGRMRPRTRETVTDGLLMFHPKDYRSEILKKYEKELAMKHGSKIIGK